MNNKQEDNQAGQMAASLGQSNAAANTPTPLAESRMNLLTRLGWMVCSMPDLLKNFVWDAFVLFYYTQVLGLNGAYMGAALLVILSFDALVNPYIGAVSDRLRNTRLGRRHSLMAWGIPPFIIGIYAVLSPPAQLQDFNLFLWLVLDTHRVLLLWFYYCAIHQAVLSPL